VIVGFPGETSEYFNDTFRFIQSLDITYLHVFTYSERPGTKSQLMEGKVDEKEKHHRSQLLHAVSERKKKEFYARQLGKPAQVLWESDNIGGFMHGFTGNYVEVRTKFNLELINNITKVRITAYAGDDVCEVEF